MKPGVALDLLKTTYKEWSEDNASRLAAALAYYTVFALAPLLPDVTVHWKDVWIGAAATALLFTVGKLLIGLYLGHASVGSTYGAAGSLLVLLVWVYYSSQILFFGAEFTQVYARRFGSRIVPAEGAVPLTEEARAEQGIPRKEAVEASAGSNGKTSAESAARSGYGGGAQVNGTSRDGKSQDGQQKHAASSARSTNGNGHESGGNPDALKPVLWAALASGTTAVAALLARQVGAAVWETVMHEPPPTKKV